MTEVWQPKEKEKKKDLLDVGLMGLQAAGTIQGIQNGAMERKLKALDAERISKMNSQNDYILNKTNLA